MGQSTPQEGQEVSNPLVEILKKALRDAANANGTPVPDYYGFALQIELYQTRTERVAAIIAAALKECPE